MAMNRVEKNVLRELLDACCLAVTSMEIVAAQVGAGVIVNSEYRPNLGAPEVNLRIAKLRNATKVGLSLLESQGGTTAYILPGEEGR